MAKRNPESFPFPAATAPSPTGDLLTLTLREGAQKMLASAIEAEVAEHLAARSCLTDEHGRRQVVRNGHLPTREILTGVGAIEVTHTKGAESMLSLRICYANAEQAPLWNRNPLLAA